jgi:hypothetical protein
VKINYIYFAFLCGISVLGTKGQSVTIDPSVLNPILTSRDISNIDINKTGTNNSSGLRFFQNQTARGGLFYNDNNEVFNLSNLSGSAGFVWDRTNQRAGIGTFTPSAKLAIRFNSTSILPHILINESNGTDGGRINFENTGIENKRWTLFGRNSESAVPSANIFNLFHSEFGNVAQFFGDGNTALNGFTKLGSDAPKIKMKKFTGNTRTDGFPTAVIHGLDYDKILAVDVLIKSENDVRYLPDSHPASTNTYRIGIVSDSILFTDLDFSLYGRPYTVFITYEE